MFAFRFLQLFCSQRLVSEKNEVKYALRLATQVIRMGPSLTPGDYRVDPEKEKTACSPFTQFLPSGCFVLLMLKQNRLETVLLSFKTRALESEHKEKYDNFCGLIQ